jgi:hypothetical protein
MKTTKIWIIVLTIVALLALPGSALAAGPEPDLSKIIYGGNYVLEDGETLRDDLWILGGNANLEAGSRVTGNVLLMGGNLQADGQIDGNVNVFEGNIGLSSTTVIQGDVNVLGGSLTRNGARIEGKVNQGWSGPFWNWNFVPGELNIPFLRPVFNPFWDIASLLFRSLLLAALAMLVVLVWPTQAERAAQAVIAQPLIAGVSGLATIFVAVFVIVVLTLTICLIPVSLLGGIFVLCMLVFGWAALGLETGKRIAQMFKAEWAPAISAGLGTFILTLVVMGFDQMSGWWFLLACLGWAVSLLVWSLALGGVLLTRFGTQAYPGTLPTHPAPPAPPPAIPPVLQEAPTPTEPVEPQATPITAAPDVGEGEAKPRRTRKKKPTE